MGNYTKKTECPEPIKDLIKSVNALPSDPAETWDSFQEAFEDAAMAKKEDKKVLKIGNVESLKKASKTYAELFKSFFNKEIADYCFADDRFLIGGVEKKFEIILESQFLFNLIASINDESAKLQQSKNKIKQSDTIKQYEKDGFTAFQNLSWQSANSSGWMINEKGFIKPRFGYLHKILLENDISFYRIKKCPVCLRIYWSKNLNSLTCGERDCAYTRYNKANKKEKFPSRVIKENGNIQA